MAEFAYLERAEFDAYAEVLFGILADNMTKIAPTGNTREEDYRSWYGAVSDGLRSERRQIVLIRGAAGGEVVGFFQYYTNAETFMMEEIQLIPAVQGSGIFRALYGFLMERLPRDIAYAEAYANRRNGKSQGILRHLGLEVIGENKSGTSLHFRGEMRRLREWMGRETS